MSSTIPPVLFTARPVFCQSGIPLKDAAFSSADIKRNLSTAKIRAECAAIVNLRSDRITAEDIFTNSLTVNQLFQASPPLGNFEGSGDLLPFVVTTINTWEVLPAATLSWVIDGNANNIVTSGNTLVVNRDGYYSLSLNINYTLTIATPSTIIGWIINGSNPSFPLFMQSSSGSFIQNATINVFLTTGSTVQLGINSTDITNTIVINDAHSSFGFLGAT